MTVFLKPKPAISKTQGTDLMDNLTLQQYDNKPNLRAFMLAYIEEMDLLFEQAQEVYLGRMIEYAEGKQLDIIGIILDEDRAIQLPVNFFGFRDETVDPVIPPGVGPLADESNPGDGGVFRSEGQEGVTTYPLSDIEYRRVLLAKAVLNLAETCDINRIYFVSAVLMGRVPQEMKIYTSTSTGPDAPTLPPRQMLMKLSQFDTSPTDQALIEYFAKYMVPMGSVFAVTRT